MMIISVSFNGWEYERCGTKVDYYGDDGYQAKVTWCKKVNYGTTIRLHSDDYNDSCGCY